MKEYLILLFISGMIIIFYCWNNFLVKQAEPLWQKLKFEKLYFNLVLLLCLFSQLFIIIHNKSSNTGRIEMIGYLLLKLSFIFLLSAMLCYYFSERMKFAVYRMNKISEITTAIFCLAYSLCNTYSYALTLSLFALGFCALLMSLKTKKFNV